MEKIEKEAEEPERSERSLKPPISKKTKKNNNKASRKSKISQSDSVPELSLARSESENSSQPNPDFESSQKIKDELMSAIEKAKKDLSQDIERRSGEINKNVMHKIKKHCQECTTKTKEEVKEPIKDIEAELREGVAQAVVNDELSSQPIENLKPIAENKATLISTEYFCEELRSEAVPAATNLEKYLIGCLAPLQIAPPQNEFISVEDMYLHFSLIFFRSELETKEKEPSEIDEEDYLRKSLDREEIEDEERKTAELMTKMIKLRTDELLKKTKAVESDFKKYDENIKKLEEENKDEEKKLILSEYKEKIERLEKFAQQEAEQAYEEDEENNNEEDTNKLMKANEEILKEANIALGLDKEEAYISEEDRMKRSLSSIRESKAESVSEIMEPERESQIEAKPTGKKVEFAPDTKSKPEKKKPKMELERLMNQAKINKAMGEAFDEMAKLINKYNIKC